MLPSVKTKRLTYFLHKICNLWDWSLAHDIIEQEWFSGRTIFRYEIENCNHFNCFLYLQSVFGAHRNVSHGTEEDRPYKIKSHGNDLFCFVFRAIRFDLKCIILMWFIEIVSPLNLCFLEFTIYTLQGKATSQSCPLRNRKVLSSIFVKQWLQTLTA